MTCHNCRTECKRHGRDRKGNQRFQCRQCSKTFPAPQDKPLDGMYLPMEQAEMILKMLVDGMSVSAIERMTGVHHGTILKLLVLAGERCEKIMGQYVRNVRARDIEMDEVWSFIGKKEKRVRPEDDQNLGDAYTFDRLDRTRSSCVFTFPDRQRTADRKEVLKIIIRKKELKRKLGWSLGLRQTVKTLLTVR